MNTMLHEISRIDPGLSALMDASITSTSRLERCPSRLRRSVLVVDDDTNIPPVVQSALARYHFEIDSVYDGQSALLRLQSQLYDLVILDLGMAGLDGLEVMQTMKRKARLRKVPVMVLTSDDSEQALARSFGYGADDFVIKPFKLYDLGMRAYRLVHPFPGA
jgi:DNA-binding response OmpR family regulator